MNLILYNGHKFYGMRDVPEEPESGCNWVFKKTACCPEGKCETEKEWVEYRKKLESCKSSALKIVNPELLDIHEWENAGVIFLGDNEDPLKDGDTFPLPSDLKFEEEEKEYAKGLITAVPLKETVLRLVKVVSEESQEKLWDEFKERIANRTLHWSQVDRYFTIQRKKP